METTDSPASLIVSLLWDRVGLKPARTTHLTMEGGRVRCAEHGMLAVGRVIFIAEVFIVIKQETNI